LLFIYGEKDKAAQGLSREHLTSSRSVSIAFTIIGLIVLGGATSLLLIQRGTLSGTNSTSNSTSSSISSENTTTSITEEYQVRISFAQNPIVRGNIQTIYVSVSSSKGIQISGLQTNFVITYPSGFQHSFSNTTDSNGDTFTSWRISGDTKPGTFQVEVIINNNQIYNSSFQVIPDTETSTSSISSTTTTFSATTSSSSFTSTSMYELLFQQSFAQTGSILASSCTMLTNEGVWQQNYGSGTGSSLGWPPSPGSSGTLLIDCGNGNPAFNVVGHGYETPTFDLPSAFTGLYLVIAPGQSGYANDPCNLTSLSIHNNPIMSGQSVQFSPAQGKEAGSYNYCLTYSNWATQANTALEVGWSSQ
jgi:hypothetical protein